MNVIINPRMRETLWIAYRKQYKIGSSRKKKESQKKIFATYFFYFYMNVIKLVHKKQEIIT